MNYLGIWAFVGLIVFGTLLLIAVLTLLIMRRRIARCTKSVPGTYVGTHVMRRGRARAYIPIVHYVVDGVEYEVNSSYTEGFGGFSDHPIGTPVTVFYDPTNPTYVWATRTGTSGQHKGMFIMLWIGIAGFVICGLYLLILFMMAQ